MFKGIAIRGEGTGLIVSALYVVLCVTFIIYLPGLNGPLLFDDFVELAPLMDSDTKDLSTLVGNHILSESGPLHRPVSKLSFILNAISYGDGLWGWKYTNLLIHLFIGAAIFWLTGRLLASTTGGRSWPVALVVGTIWLLHPLHVSTVLYTIQRMTQLSALFVILGLLSYTIGRQRQILSQRRGGLYVGLAFLCFFPLATFSKENGLLFPLFAALVEVSFFRFKGNPPEKHAVALFFAAFLVIPGVLALGYLASHFSDFILAGYAQREFTLVQRVLTEFRVLVDYIVLLLMPIQRNMGFFHDDLIISTGWLSPPTTLLSFLSLASLFVFAIMARRRLPIVTFGLLFFFIGHLLESTLFPLELMYEHRNYLPSFGIILTIVGLGRKYLVRPKLKGIVVSISTLALVVLTWQRAETWRSADIMYASMFHAHPTSERLIILHANVAAESANFKAARALLGGRQRVGYRLNLLYLDCQERGKASALDLGDISRSMQGIIRSYEITGLLKLAKAGIVGECKIPPTDFLALLDKALEMPIRYAINRQKLLLYKAHYLYILGDVSAAIQALDESFLASPRNPVALFLATEWLIKEGDMKHARSYFDRARRIANDSLKDYSSYIDSIKAKFNKLSKS